MLNSGNNTSTTKRRNRGGGANKNKPTKPIITKPKTQADYKEIRTGRPISRYTPTKPKTKPTGPTITKPKVAPSPSTRSGNIGRTTTKYDGKARVAPKPQDNTKKKNNYGKSGMGMAAYQRLNRGRG